MKNPFKFGTVVEEPYFTNRISDIAKIENILDSSNHLIIISPRRYGKTSLIQKVVNKSQRPIISLDLQLISNIEDFASQILKRIYKIYPIEMIKQSIANFRIIPSLSLNPMNNEIEVSFQPKTSMMPALEDVLNLLDKLSSSKKKVIVILDEFQEIRRIDNSLERQLRSIIQFHQNLNYVFLGSQESMMREIFEKKKSPFYHFGYLMNLDKIGYSEFKSFLASGFKEFNQKEIISDQILAFTDCHPYYTQQLAFTVWNLFNYEKIEEEIVQTAIEQLVNMHDLDYERLWNSLNQTDKIVLISLSQNNEQQFSNSNKLINGLASSTVFSSLKRLINSGYVIKSNHYEIDDPFFKRWIIRRRNM
jgi:hypothetical protein